ncbi:MAG: diaminopimelate decarboxylase [Planctomycetota bacterium]|jgi:diaminopimelate decarboxylase
MDYFHYEGGALRCEGVKVADIAAEVGTPCYIYSKRTAVEHYRKIAEAFDQADPVICFSVKTNGNLAYLDTLRREGAGFDVVSGGELARCLKIGADPRSIVFAGVGKSDAEINAALDAGILMFNVESAGELNRIAELATAKGTTARIAIRLNPNVDPKTHKHITTGKRENKFGVDGQKARFMAERALALDAVDVIGVHLHIGSQITQPESHAEAMDAALELIAELRAKGHPIQFVNVGGGYGIDYHTAGEALPISAFAELLVPKAKAAGVRLALEPGRFIAGNSGLLVGKVLYVKESGDKQFFITDAGMNDLIRPSLYEAYHRVWPVESDREPFDEQGSGLVTADVVGPICESTDFFAKDRLLPPVTPGDLLAVFSAGAYAFVMASNYNARPKPPEVLVDGDSWRVVRRRETYEDLWRCEEEI